MSEFVGFSVVMTYSQNPEEGLSVKDRQIGAFTT